MSKTTEPLLKKEDGKMNSLNVSEHFYSLQGEGSMTGKPAVFLRLQYCNLNCGAIQFKMVKDKTSQEQIEAAMDRTKASWYCDSTHVWLHGKSYTVNSLYKIFDEKGYFNRFSKGAHFIITGGEPLMQQDGICSFLNTLPVFKPYVEIETNGTIFPKQCLDSLVEQYNVSPKLSNSGNGKHLRYRPNVLEWHANCPKSYFKFVITHSQDIDEVVNDFVERFNIPNERVYIMPGATTRNELYKNAEMVAELCKTKHFNMSTRLQLEAWDKATGV